MKTGKLFLDTLHKARGSRVPFWFMRQAGRYLPEYREIRQRSGGFLKMVYDPKTACEITMQPIRRFGMDAAVIFSDILVVPDALGQKVEFVEGEGPKLEPLKERKDFSILGFRDFEAKLAPVYQALADTRAALYSGGFRETALLGFCGAPWTLAAYMIEGGGGSDFIQARKLAYQDPGSFSALMAVLVEALSQFLIRQIDSGAEAVQIFDSHAGVLDSHEYKKWVIAPTVQIVRAVRSRHPYTPIIGFPRGSGQNYLVYAQETTVDGVGLDTQVPPRWAARTVQPLVPVQGNLDPACLLAGGDAMLLAAERVLIEFSNGPFIFNLGHGVHKDTPVENVEKLVRLIRDYKV